MLAWVLGTITDGDGLEDEAEMDGRAEWPRMDLPKAVDVTSCV